MCPHGGTAILTTSNSKLSVGGVPALLQTDVHAVAGCPFQIPVGAGTKPSPCIRIEWQAGTTKLGVGGPGVLVQSSVGICYSPEGAPQGTAIIANASPKVNAT
jgi:hypothetical protein